MTDAAAGTPAAVGVDVGGTNLRVALVTAAGDVVDRRRAPSTGDVLADLARLVDELGGGDLPIGMGVASMVRDRRVAVFGPNLALGTVDLVDALGRGGDRHVVVENDANAAMYAEWKVGAGQGHDDLVMVTMGTGVGGGAVVDGRLLRGANGFGGEAGHTPLVSGGRPCACGRAGCLEAYASGGAIAVTAREALALDATPSSLRALPTGVVDGRAVSEAAASGDALAIAVLEQTGDWLGEGVTGLVNLLDPALVIVGGGVAEAVGQWVLPRLAAALAAQIEGHGHREPPPVVAASCGDDAGIVGAALLALA